MPVTFKLDPIFDRQKLRQVLGDVPMKAAERFAEYVPEQQNKEVHTGKVRTIRGKKHRASAKGERPAKLSGRLNRATKAKKTGNLKAEVTTVAKRNGFDYPAHLEEKLDRPIQNKPEDIRTAQRMLDEEAEKALKRLS